MPADAVTRAVAHVALAALGWLLVMPPETTNAREQFNSKAWQQKYKKDPSRALKSLYDLKAPLARWSVMERFETGQQCNSWRAQLRLMTPTVTTTELSKCVASGDRRLKQK